MHRGYATYISTRENKAFCIGNDSTDAGRALTSENEYFSANSLSSAGFCFYMDGFCIVF